MIKRLEGRYKYEKTKGMSFDPAVATQRSRTKQNFKKECEISHLLERFIKTGTWCDPNVVATRQPMFGDFTSFNDYHKALCKIEDLKSTFMLLPVNVRDRFHNDPGELVDFVSDPVNEKECISLGLKPKPPLDTHDEKSVEPPK